MNWHLIGHQWAVDLLSEHLLQGNLRQAYLITGPSGVGRRTLGLRLAQALACRQPPAPGQPCLACSACKKLENNQHPDLTTVQAETIGGTLKVEQIRDLQHTLALSPYEAQYRVAMLLRFEEAHESAQNALLKTLEEPFPKVILILTAESAESILPTILSRCEVLRLRPTGIEFLSQQLETEKQIPHEDAETLAHFSAGCPGYALRLHQDKEMFERRNGWIDDLWRLTGANRTDRFAFAELWSKTGTEKETQYEILLTWISFWHDILVTCSGSKAPLTHLKWNVEINLLAQQVTPAAAREVIRTFEAGIQRLRRNINARLTFEVLLLDLPRLRLS